MSSVKSSVVLLACLFAGSVVATRVKSNSPNRIVEDEDGSAAARALERRVAVNEAVDAVEVPGAAFRVGAVIPTVRGVAAAPRRDADGPRMGSRRRRGY